MRTSIFVLLIAMASIQIGASFAKQLFPLTGAIGATTLRLCFASIMLSLIWKPWKVRLKHEEWLNIALYGASLGCMNLFFYLALERVPLGLTVALEFTGPLAVALCSSRRIFDFLWALFAVFGVSILLPFSASTNTIDLVGILFAILAGGCWASYIVFGKRVGTFIQGGKAASLGMAIATLVVLPIGISIQGLKLLNLSIFPTAFGVALLSSAIPYSLEMIALRALPAKTFSILMSLEPVFAAISGFILLHENLTGSQWLAIVLIIAASVGSTWSAQSEK